ncbi:MAG: phage protease, partial [Bryobacteraceae bacterium]
MDMQKIGRVIRLSEGDGRLVRFVSESIRLGEDQPTSWVTVTRTGEFSDPRYGKFSITPAMLAEMVKNFTGQAYGQDIFIDVAHKPENGAAGKVVALAVEGDRLRAKVEWTPMGVEAVRAKGYAYLSAEYHENWRDNEAGNPHGCVLLGAGLVTRPCIKRLDPVQLSEADGESVLLLHPKLLNDLISEVKDTMKKHLEELAKQLAAKGMSDNAIAAVISLAEKAMTGMTDEAQMKALCEAFAADAKKLTEGGPVTVNVAGGLTAADVAAAVAKQLAERDDAAKKLAETQAGNVKLLGEQIAELGKALSEDTRKELIDGLTPAITAEMSAPAIKALAEVQVKMAEKAEANKQLAASGFHFRGNAHITVDSTNEVLKLQETIDRRLGITPPKDSPNAELVNKVLAQFDAERGAELSREHKHLAAGDGIISDVSVPAIFERTVIREALYPLVALQFVNVGTSEFAVAAQIPYSYRDVTAAGRDSTRKYEGQGIARAGIKQAMETAYPIPQKLAFEVSDELRYLTGAGRIDFDATTENVRNASRIIGEDLERLILNECVNAGDEFAVSAGNDTLTATVNGTNKVFVTSNFPVVRPRKVFDLQGNQVGSTVNPIVVTLNSIVRQEYDGSGTQSAGTYYTMDYNLGEIRFVSETGASVTPTNAWPLTVTYSYTTNVTKFDTDLGSLKVGEKWDDFIYRYGLRRSVLEDQRFYRANFGLMSGTVHEQVLLANQFAAINDRGNTSVSGA